MNKTNSTLNKSQSPTDFKENDLIFAKVKGHKPWPAKIENIDNKTFKNVIKYQVKFFETNETAILNKCNLYHYNENKLKYLPESIASRLRDTYKKVLIKIQNSWEAVRLLQNVGSPLVEKSTKTHSNIKNQISMP